MMAHIDDVDESGGYLVDEGLIGIQDCRKRWLHSLDPSLRKGRWTSQEDEILLSAYARLGPLWNDIGKLHVHTVTNSSDIRQPLSYPEEKTINVLKDTMTS